MKSTKDKTLCTTVGCTRPRRWRNTRCSECLKEVNEMNYIRHHGRDSSKKQDNDPAIMGNPALPMEATMTCRFFGCEWTGKRRDYLKDSSYFENGKIKVKLAHYKKHVVK